MLSLSQLLPFAGIPKECVDDAFNEVALAVGARLLPEEKKALTYALKGSTHATYPRFLVFMGRFVALQRDGHILTREDCEDSESTWNAAHK